MIEVNTMIEKIKFLDKSNTGAFFTASIIPVLVGTALAKHQGF